MLPFLKIQRQRCIKSLCPKDPEFYTPLALNCQKGPAPEVYKNQSPMGGGGILSLTPCNSKALRPNKSDQAMPNSENSSQLSHFVHHGQAFCAPPSSNASHALSSDCILYLPQELQKTRQRSTTARALATVRLQLTAVNSLLRCMHQKTFTIVSEGSLSGKASTSSLGGCILLFGLRVCVPEGNRFRTSGWPESGKKAKVDFGLTGKTRKWP